MAIRTVTFKSVMDRAFRKVGIDPTQPQAATKLAVGEYIDEHVRRGWEFAAWPEWSDLEERALRPEYDAAWPNEINDEVHYSITDKYYRCRAANTGEAPGNAAYWDELTKVDSYLELAQRGQVVMGMIYDVYPRDPLACPDQTALRITDSGSRVWIECAPATVWVKFRLPAPQFTSMEVVDATTYAPGDVVYSATTGQCYVALVAALGSAIADAEKWTVQPLPLVLRDYASLRTAASLQSEDGQDLKAMKLEAEAQSRLEEERAKFMCVAAGAEPM